MATIQDTMNRVDQLLRFPKAQQPSQLQRMKTVLAKYQSMFNQLTNTGVSWATAETVLTVSQGVEDYELTNAGNFGKALLINTLGPGNPSYIPRPIPVFGIENLFFDEYLPKNVGNWWGTWDGTTANALRMAFFRKAGFNNTYVRVYPVPQIAAEYSILYSIGDWADSAALQSEMLLPEHHELAAVRASISLLPSADWVDDEGMNSNRRKELGMALANDQAEYSANWVEYIRTIAHPRMVYRQCYGGW